MASMTIELPDSIPEAEAKLLLAIKLYEEGRLSCGKAAEFSGRSKKSFMELLGKRGIPLYDMTSKELESDRRHARGPDGKQH